MATSVLLLIATCVACTESTRFERGFIPVSAGGQIYYEAEGEGQPLLLLHGHTLDLRMWDPQMKAFTDAGYRVIRPEMRGYGRSSKQGEGLQFTHLDDMMTVLDSLHLDRVHVVGLSMGSFVASEMVAMHPERLLTATLASGNIRKRPGPSAPIDSTEQAKLAAELEANREKGVEQWKRDWIEKLIAGGGSNAEAIRESLTRQVMEWDGWQILHGEGRFYYANEAWALLRERKPELPVLIISGEMEHKSPKNAMMPYLPNSRNQVIPDCGHMTNMEKPDEFTRLVLDHLKR
ncbi:MAG: alpha/beta hydrolase [Bacteroidales bacterium]|nr:alpha/beta hydrolase [Candidatus Liminaster caballi]